MNQKTKILNILKRNKRGVYNWDLNNICFRYSARIMELRKEGHNISVELISKGVYKYYLTGKK